MKTTVLAAVIGAGMLAASTAAWSQFYLGVAVGQTKFKNACEGAPSGASCDDKDSAFKFFAGHRFGGHFAVELGVSDLGTVEAASESAALNAVDLAALASWPLGQHFAIHGRLGVYRGEMDVKSRPVAVAFGAQPPSRGWRSGNNSGRTFGFGASYEPMSNLATRLEWQRFDDLGGNGGPKLDVDVVSLGVLLRF